MVKQEREPRDGFVAVGRVLRPWGLRGDLKVESLTDFPDRFAPGQPLWLDGVERTVERVRTQKGALYVKLAGIDDATVAEAFRGHYLEVPESALRVLDEDEFYHHELIGLQVRTSDGSDLGRVVELLPTGGNVVLVVRGPRGEVLLPFVEDVVRLVDVQGGVITVELMEGLVDAPAPPRAPRPRARRPARVPRRN